FKLPVFLTSILAEGMKEAVRGPNINTASFGSRRGSNRVVRLRLPKPSARQKIKGLKGTRIGANQYLAIDNQWRRGGDKVACLGHPLPGSSLEIYCMELLVKVRKKRPSVKKGWCAGCIFTPDRKMPEFKTRF